MSSRSTMAGQELRAFEERALSHEEPSDFSDLVMGAKRKRTNRRRSRALASFAVAACAAIAFVTLRPSPDAPALAKNTPAEAPPSFAPSVGERISTTQASKTFGFAEGEVTLRPQSLVTITALEKHRTELTLIDGMVVVDVPPAGDNAWRMIAGPYLVSIVSAAFSLGHKEESDSVSLEVQRGLVQVSGPGIEGTRELRAGQSLSAVLTEPHVSPSSVAKKKPSTRAKAVRSNAPLDWKKLAKQGKYVAAIRNIEKSGFDATANALNVGDLVRLADVARMAGRSDRATTILRRIRLVAPGTTHSASAAYSLGTTAFDQRGSFAEAARWFSTYLREAPGGRPPGAR